VDLILRDVRSFSGEHSIPIRPLTVLVGENSSGKSTFLAMLAAVSTPWFPTVRSSFSEPPYDLGSFDSIATYKGGRFGRAENFAVGYSYTRKKSETIRKVLATFKENHGQPSLCHVQIQNGKSQLNIKFEEKRAIVDVILHTKKGELQKTFEGEIGFALENLNISLFPSVLFNLLSTTTKSDRELRSANHELMSQIYETLGFDDRRPVITARSIAPIRTKPKRTYDEFNDEFKPEGDHVPLMMAREFEYGGDKKKTQILSNALSEFGDQSGLFKKIDVRRLGKRASSPFQVLVKVAAQFSNLPDVGYGVSQALPILVESVLSPKNTRLLLQQPEVHLHPKAQSALGTFFAHLVAEEKKQLVMETHSDYIIDRIRLAVSKGVLSPKDVAIIFFDRQGSNTTEYVLDIDADGNIINAPTCYRDFFVKEETAILTREGGA
jgi:energy-coupling factor transporter ATP-binding protein EcfA2